MSSPLDRVPFEARLRALRDSWNERRETLNPGGEHDLESRTQTLRMLRSWVEQCVPPINEIYESPIAVLGPVSGGMDSLPSFTLRLHELYSIRFYIEERTTKLGTRFSVSAEARSPAGRLRATSIGPDRRHGVWSRTRIENIILSLLSEYERDQLNALRRRAEGQVLQDPVLDHDDPR
jgi:hypothetical protein